MEGGIFALSLYQDNECSDRFLQFLISMHNVQKSGILQFLSFLDPKILKSLNRTLSFFINFKQLLC